MGADSSAGCWSSSTQPAREVKAAFLASQRQENDYLPICASGLSIQTPPGNVLPADQTP